MNLQLHVNIIPEQISGTADGLGGWHVTSTIMILEYSRLRSIIVKIYFKIP